ncbi:hypothetical protein [Hymenobacter jeollabukensis]|uniref:Uncharacterized protein n=1 Tax=Hymenobacter jeollabukensis TaxID=2025313 RepID=A0A5R8WKK1_9BACT|nr:hypothetical protein [Hymenobacter jeollabukensis]TLM89083.1 hypothetical protein FDY95_21170 [Hymenobacter jeollabukensis]
MSRACLLLMLVLLCGGAACTRSAPVVESPAPGRPGHSNSRPLNVAALVGRNIDQVRQRLGPPRETRQQPVGLEPTAEQLRATRGEGWINTFEKDGTTIVVTFNARTREVQDLVLVGSNEDELLRRGNLDFVADNYLVLPVTDPAAPSRIMGVRVVAR